MLTIFERRLKAIADKAKWHKLLYDKLPIKKQPFLFPMRARKAKKVQGGRGNLRHCRPRGFCIDRHIPWTKLRGVLYEDGDYVNAGTILVRQGLPQYFPGLNTRLGSDRSISAMINGKVYITTERVVPNWNRVTVNTVFGQYRKIEADVPFYRQHVSIIGDPVPQSFKLVSQN